MKCRKAGDMTMDGVRGRVKLKSGTMSLDLLIQSADRRALYTVV